MRTVTYLAGTAAIFLAFALPLLHWHRKEQPARLATYEAELEADLGGALPDVDVDELRRQLRRRDDWIGAGSLLGFLGAMALAGSLFDVFPLPWPWLAGLLVLVVSNHLVTLIACLHAVPRPPSTVRAASAVSRGPSQLLDRWQASNLRFGPLTAVAAVALSSTLYADGVEGSQIALAFSALVLLVVVCSVSVQIVISRRPMRAASTQSVEMQSWLLRRSMSPLPRQVHRLGQFCAATVLYTAVAGRDDITDVTVSLAAATGVVSLLGLWVVRRAKRHGVDSSLLTTVPVARSFVSPL